MNLVTGEIVEIYLEDGTTMATVSVSGALMRVALIFVPEAHVGDTILVESGVAISRVKQEEIREN